MTETLLSPSNVLLFGRKVEDLRIVRSTKPIPEEAKLLEARVATDANIAFSGANRPASVDGVTLAADDKVLVRRQDDKKANGLYIAKIGSGETWARDNGMDADDDFEAGPIFVKVSQGSKFKETLWELVKFKPKIGSYPIKFQRIGKYNGDEYFDPRHGPFIDDRGGGVGQVEGQLTAATACFARIYGFSFEGTYYELPRPALFLVHGEGTEVDLIDTGLLRRGAQFARAPTNPSVTGLASADFTFADDLKVWSYDRADYTIRMDVESGMFEDILLEPFFGGDGGGGVSGARVGGARVGGARVGGARVGGARVSGARLSGGRGDASD